MVKMFLIAHLQRRPLARSPSIAGRPPRGRQRHRPQLGQVPTSLNHCPGQAAADGPPLQALYLKAPRFSPLSLGTTRLTPGTCSSRWRTRLTSSFESRPSTSTATLSTPTAASGSPPCRRHQFALADDDDLLAGLLNFRQTCALRMMVWSPASFSMSSRVSMICLGSRPAVGSSSTSTSGLWMIAGPADPLAVALG